MTDKAPQIVTRRKTKISPWMEIIEREVSFAANTPVQSYHAVGQADYVGILAVTPDQTIPIVRQYRPAVESYTWELPAGLVDGSEDPAEAARRELLEETGLPSSCIQALGTAAPCTGRLSNRMHSFFVETGERIRNFIPEPYLDVRLVTNAELAGLIKSGEFSSQLHLGTIALALLRGHIQLPTE